MSEELKKLKSEVEDLQQEYNKLRNEFDKPGELSGADFDKFQKGIDDLRIQHKKLDDQTVNPIAHALKDVKYHVEQIEMALGKIERGIDNTGEIESQNISLKELFDDFDEVKKDLKTLESDFEDMENDISDERKKVKTAAVDIRRVVSQAMKKAKQSMVS